MWLQKETLYKHKLNSSSNLSGDNTNGEKAYLIELQYIKKVKQLAVFLTVFQLAVVLL